MCNTRTIASKKNFFIKSWICICPLTVPCRSPTLGTLGDVPEMSCTSWEDFLYKVCNGFGFGIFQAFCISLSIQGNWIEFNWIPLKKLFCVVNIPQQHTSSQVFLWSMVQYMMKVMQQRYGNNMLKQHGFHVPRRHQSITIYYLTRYYLEDWHVNNLLITRLTLLLLLVDKCDNFANKNGEFHIPNIKKHFSNNHWHAP